MAFCTNCGAKIKGDTKFCPNCGASVEGTPQTPKGSSAPGPAPQGAAGSAAQGKALAMLKRNYKLIGIAVLAVVVLLLLFSRGTGGKGDNALAQFQGYWDRKGLVDSDVTIGMTRPNYIGITENALQLDAKLYTCPMSETEYKDGALYFSAQWYQSLPYLGQGAGMQNYSLRLTYDESSDLLTLDLSLIRNGRKIIYAFCLE